MSETPDHPESHVTESKPAGAETGATAGPHGSLLSHHDTVQGSGGHAGPSVKTYLVIFGALAGFTLVSFVANYFSHPDVAVISKFTSFAIILSVAVCKATLVGMYFMHLILDWGKVFIIIVPALILGPLLMIVLMPDIVLAWKHITPP